jgi:hypothetical protein
MMKAMGFFILAVGIWFILFHRTSGRQAQEWYGFLLSPRGEKLIRIECIAFGLLFFTVGLLSLLGVLRRAPGP